MDINVSKKINRNVFWLGMTSFFNDVSSEMVISILPAFFISVLKTGAQSLGVVEGVADAFANFIKIYSGRLSDKLKKRKIFAVLGYAVSVASRPFYLLADSVLGVVGIRIADRLGKGTREAPRDLLISLSIPENEAGKSFGFHRAMDTLGGIAGPLIAYLILRATGDSFSTVFIVSFIIGIFAIASLALVKEVANLVRSEEDGGFKTSLPQNFKKYLITIFVLSLGSLPLGVLLFRTGSVGLEIAAIPLFYAIYNLTYAMFSFPAGKMADRVGSRKVIFYGYLALIAAYIVLIYFATVITLILAFLLIGFYSALTDAVQRSYVSVLVNKESRGTAYGWFNAVTGFGALFAGIGGGFLWQNFGDTTALLLASLLIVLGLMSFLMTKDKAKE